jgi:hypothetical protein
MGMFDKMKDLASDHAEQVEEGLDKAADVVKDKTGGKHDDMIDKAKDTVSDQLLDEG